MKVSFETSPRNEVIYRGEIKPFTPIRYDFCPHCSTHNIELFSFNNYPQNYSEAVNAYLKLNNVLYDKYEIRCMRCKSCRKEFMIDWSSGFPKPLKDPYKVLGFIAEFEQGF